MRITFSEELFRSKIVISETGCHLWTAFKNPAGYGQVGVKNDGKRGLALAHRAAWQLAFGDIPDGVCVLHRCDVPACVNPEHLFLGTRGDNNRDTSVKGRHVGRRGQRARFYQKGIKINRYIAEAIRADKRLLREIAATYDLNISTVSKIRLGKRWLSDAPI